jgi:3-methylfumaryl-CoA hydratase
MKSTDKPIKSWIGNEENVTDMISGSVAERLAATLNRETNFSLSKQPDLPPLWHWCHFIKPITQSALGEDGHLAKGNFLPPIPLPRRMWASGSLYFRQPLKIGLIASRQSEIIDIQEKQGQSGKLIFVMLKHNFYQEKELMLSEEQNLVYRDHSTKKLERHLSQTSNESSYDYAAVIQPNTVELFRYSALTFNSHRIHFDQPYTTQIEEYPKLIVHGPLLATHLLELAHRSLGIKILNRLEKFEFRAKNPAFVNEPLHLSCSKPDQNSLIHLSAKNDAGIECMTARATIK